MKILKKVAVRIIPVGVLAFLSVAAIAYQRGVYDITFIERPAQQTADTSSPDTSADTAPYTEPDTSPAVTDDTAPAETSQNVSTDTTAPDTVTPDKTDEVTKLLNSLESTASALSRGYRITDGVFDSSMKLTLLDPAVTIMNKYSITVKPVTQYERIPNEDGSGYTVSSYSNYTDAPVVDVYMDYILVDNGDYTVTVLNNEGNILYGGFDIETYVPAYTRDRDGNAQFAATVTQKKVTSTKYYMFDADGNFTESDYNDAADNRGLYINYPTYFGISDNGYTTAARNGEFGFMNERGSILSGYRYTGAYNFSEDLAAVTKLDEVIGQQVLSYVRTNFTNKITGSASNYNYGPYYNLSGRRVSSVYRLPETRGAESLGFFYFDHGLCRIRRQEYDYYHTYDPLAYEYPGQHYIRLYTDEDLVMRIDGTLYDTPGGYTVKSYSDGVFLLEKDGLYGYMDYTGRWIIQPVYSYAEPFNEGLAVIGDGDKRGLICTDGSFVLPIIFDHVSGASGGIIAAYDGANGWAVFNKVTE